MTMRQSFARAVGFVALISAAQISAAHISAAHAADMQPVLKAPGAVDQQATGYVEVLRGTPALLQIFVIYFGLASYGIRLEPLPAAAITLSILGGAYVTEIIRAGIEAVDRGQVEAAESLGMSKAAIMRRIVLPQAAVMMLPPFTNYLISLIKDTSLALTISVPEIMYRSYDVASQTFRSMDIYAIAGVIYLAMCFPLSRLARRLERRNAR